ncbi:MAG: lysylphosphatidylglycerol synthase transmembrane domain-containing protein [Pseudolabrys sp.]
MAKAAVSALLLYLSLRRVDLSHIGERLSALDPRWIGFVLIVLCVQIPLGALRWREIVETCGAKLSAALALQYSFIGIFFSQVLPSTVGGDAVRIWLLARGGAGWPTAIYSVLIDRVVGVSALAMIVVGCLPWTLELVQNPAARGALAVIGFGALAGAAIFLALGLPQLNMLDRWWPTRHLAIASRMAWRLCQSSSGLRVAVLMFAIHLLTVLSAWGCARAAHASTDFTQVLFLFLPVMLIATVPISIAGWGVRESAMVLAFSYAGLPESDGLIVSILYGATTLAVGALGGIVWVASGYRWGSVKTIEAETLAHDPSSS